MAVRSRFDPREDRMVLTVREAVGDRRFWVTRKLWLALYSQLSQMALPESVADSLPPSAHAATPLTSNDRELDSANAVMLDGVAWRRNESGDSFVVCLRSSQPEVRLTLPAVAIVRLRRMLEVQADRAGWDPAAAVERLQAKTIAGEAVRRARS